MGAFNIPTASARQRHKKHKSTTYVTIMLELFHTKNNETNDVRMPVSPIIKMQSLLCISLTRIKISQWHKLKVSYNNDCLSPIIPPTETL